MSIRRPTEDRAEAARNADPAATPSQPAAERLAVAPPPIVDTGPRSLEDADARYVTCRDAWTAAMRAANSGRAADLASLAIAQEAYEEASAEVQRWRSGAKVAVPIELDRNRAGLRAVIGQEMAWRRMHEPKPKDGGALSRIARKLGRRG